MKTRFLIAHKARGEQEFDVAERMTCPLCIENETDGCTECEGLGYWWIVCTSGHRAYPYWNCSFEDIAIDYDNETIRLPSPDQCVGPPPDHLPDHYQVSAAKGQGKIDATALLSAIGLGVKLDPSARRF